MIFKKIANASKLSYEEWLEYRAKGIGGSDAGSIAGLNPWKSAFSVYLDKVGEGKPIPDNQKMRIGRDLEDYVAKRFEEDTGLKVRKNNFVLQSKDHPFMLANLDREIVGENAFLECKTTGSYSAKEWEDDKVPIQYELQCLHYMATCGFDYGYIAVLIGNQDFVFKKIERDEETIQNLIEIEKRFWNEHVLKRIPPLPDGSSDYSDMLKEKYINSIDKQIEIPSLREDIDRHKELKELTDGLKNEMKVIEQRIQSEMMEYEIASVGDYRVTWKPYSSTRLDTKKFKEDNPDLFEKYSKTTNSRRFQIK